MDAKTRASFKTVYDVTQYLMRIQATPVSETVDATRHAIEDEKPHMRYRSARIYEHEKLKYTDEHGDEYVDAAVKLLEEASKA